MTNAIIDFTMPSREGRARSMRRIIVTCALLAANTLLSAPAQAQSLQTPAANPSGSVDSTMINRQPSSTLPAVSDATNPAAALDYNVQYPLFGHLKVRQDLHDAGIDLAAHYISETMANARGYKGAGTGYAQQVDVGAGFDLGKLGLSRFDPGPRSRSAQSWLCESKHQFAPSGADGDERTACPDQRRADRTRTIEGDVYVEERTGKRSGISRRCRRPLADSGSASSNRRAMMVGVRISANATESRNCGAHQAQPASQASDGHPTVQMERLHVTSLKMMPMAETVAVPMITSHLKGGVFGSNELIDASARTMLDELPRWARALKPMRA